MKEEKYSREAFDNYKLRVKVEIHPYDLGRTVTLDVYTTETDRDIIHTKLATSVREDKGYFIDIIQWTTKEQDDRYTKIIEKWLSNV